MYSQDAIKQLHPPTHLRLLDSGAVSGIWSSAPRPVSAVLPRLASSVDSSTLECSVALEDRSESAITSSRLAWCVVQDGREAVAEGLLLPLRSFPSSPSLPSSLSSSFLSSRSRTETRCAAFFFCSPFPTPFFADSTSLDGSNMLFSTPLALPTLSVFASLVRSAAIPISLDAPPTGTVELLPYNAAMPGASPSYTPKAPAAILPVADIIPFLGATDFDPDSILGQVAAGLSGLGDNAQTLVGLSNVDLAAILGGRQALAKRQLCGLFGNCPVATTSKPATTSAAPTSTPVATTTQAPANNGLCGLFGNCPKAGTTTTPVATTTSTPSTSVAPSSTSGFAT